MRRVRPGAAASRGGGTSRAAGEERTLTSVAASDTYESDSAEKPQDLPRLWHVTLSVSGPEAPSRRCGAASNSSPTTTPFC